MNATTNVAAKKEDQEMKSIVRFGLACAVVGMSFAAHAQDPQGLSSRRLEVSVSPMELFPGSDNAPGEGALSRLSRGSNSVTIEVHTSGLDPASPYSLWATVFNHPNYCATSPCGDADLPISPGHDPRVEAALIHVGGGVSGNDGRGEFVGHLFEARRGLVTSDLQFGPGLLDARRAEIHIVVRGDGQPAPGDLFAALRSFNGGCNAENQVQPPCGNQQVCVHKAR
jgi:hypothetical protein